MGKVFEALTKTTSPQAAGAKKESERQSTRPARPASQPVPPQRSTAKPEKTQSEKIVNRIGEFDPKLVALNESFSQVAESFRRLRTKILHPGSGHIPRSILVTSVAQNEGKGFVCGNLAVSLAQGVEQHALLVDCDLRKPSLARTFGLPNEAGVVEHLEEGADLETLIKPTGIPKLSILPAGPPPANPSELLGSEKMAAMMDELVSRYPDRFVIFDSPPMQAASETTVLAKHVDGVVLVVRWGMVGRELVRRLADLIGRKKILGIVFNAVEVNELEAKLYRYRGYYDYAAGDYTYQ